MNRFGVYIVRWLIAAVLFAVISPLVVGGFAAVLALIGVAGILAGIFFLFWLVLVGVSALLD